MKFLISSGQMSKRTPSKVRYVESPKTSKRRKSELTLSEQQQLPTLSEAWLACIFHKPWKRHYSVFAPHLSPIVLRAASQAALQRENLTSAWACEIFGLGATDAWT